jgi:hypothetical protein
VIAVERSQPADGLIDRGRGKFALVLEVDEKVQHACRGHRRQVGFLKVLAELTDPGVVVDPTALRQAF